ncbi:hypothetical protein C7S18_09610 [Ahniella affigens]|uniref:Uncharacterized protein n=1 Tax=Ahniella affigens TaxID=2021234 RepID=A0A2P1PRF8_9GAMM|nr:hypothetical protein [Ahniella affigens]AVP97436.1 hypothetical protein C7S18_09610 [Ahniella affigens]
MRPELPRTKLECAAVLVYAALGAVAGWQVGSAITLQSNVELIQAGHHICGKGQESLSCMLAVLGAAAGYDLGIQLYRGVCSLVHLARQHAAQNDQSW